MIDREAAQDKEPKKKAYREGEDGNEIKREEPAGEAPVADDDDGFGLPKSRLKW